MRIDALAKDTEMSTTGMSPQLRLSFTSADRPGSANPASFPPDALDLEIHPTTYRFSRAELERRLLRLMDELDHPRPRKRRGQLTHIGDIAA